jgi:hypothetical protein
VIVRAAARRVEQKAWSFILGLDSLVEGEGTYLVESAQLLIENGTVISPFL